MNCKPVDGFQWLLQFPLLVLVVEDGGEDGEEEDDEAGEDNEGHWGEDGKAFRTILTLLIMGLGLIMSVLVCHHFSHLNIWCSTQLCND